MNVFTVIEMEDNEMEGNEMEKVYRDNREHFELAKKADAAINELLKEIGLPPCETFEEYLIKQGRLDFYIGNDPFKEQ